MSDDLGPLLSEHVYRRAGPLGWFDRRRGTTVAIHENGLRVTGRSEVQVLPFSELEFLVEEGAGLDLGFTQDRRVHLGDRYSDFGPQTGELLRVKAGEVLLPRYLTSIQDGGRIRLGTVTIDAKAVSTHRQEVPLSGLKSVDRDGRKLVFTQANGTQTRMDVDKQPNVHLMVALAEHLKS